MAALRSRVIARIVYTAVPPWVHEDWDRLATASRWCVFDRITMTRDKESEIWVFLLADGVAELYNAITRRVFSFHFGHSTLTDHGMSPSPPHYESCFWGLVRIGNDRPGLIGILLSWLATNDKLCYELRGQLPLEKMLLAYVPCRHRQNKALILQLLGKIPGDQASLIKVQGFHPP